MAKFFYLDASVIAKRYVPKKATPIVNHLFRQVAWGDMICLKLGVLVVVYIFVRKKNTRILLLAMFNQAMTNFRREATDDLTLSKLPVTDSLVTVFAERD